MCLKDMGKHLIHNQIQIVKLDVNKHLNLMIMSLHVFPKSHLNMITHDYFVILNAIHHLLCPQIVIMCQNSMYIWLNLHP
jgi:hypothetical protein